MIRKILPKLHKLDYIIITQAELDVLLSEVSVEAETDTQISGFLRILAHGNQLMVQEQSPRDEIFIRRMRSRAEAQKFIAERMTIYEKMWDGCGCKVDYFA